MSVFSEHITAKHVVDYARAIHDNYISAKELDDFDANFSDIDYRIKHLEKMIFHSSPNVCNKALSELENEFMAEMNRIYCFWETAMERRFVGSILEEDDCKLSKYPLYQRFKRLLHRETSMIKADKSKKALFIGSGPVPISGIWLNHFTGMNVDCFDIDERAVGLSKILLRSIGLDKKLHAFHQVETDYDVSEYGVVLIALLAKPKSVILDNIRKTASKDCQIICRTSETGRRLLYEPLQVDTVRESGFEIVDAQFINGFSDDVISSLHLQQK